MGCGKRGIASRADSVRKHARPSRTLIEPKLVSNDRSSASLREVYLKPSPIRNGEKRITKLSPVIAPGFLYF
jgi:hypothetical protein